MTDDSPVANSPGFATSGFATSGFATLGGGCFWCLEAVFEQLKGVESVRSGYAGGRQENPTYQQVCTGKTGHAEVVQVEFDPEVVSYRDLLRIFFTIHDPTTLNRQGGDVGSQYRSAIFYHSEEQEKVAREVVAEVTNAGVWDDPLVTEISRLPAFFPAEKEHDSYFSRNQDRPYCAVVVAPKVAKFRKQFADRVRAVEPEVEGAS